MKHFSKIVIFTSLIMSSYIINKEINLSLYERRLISQNGEDGILKKIFEIIGSTNKYYVEFGAGNGHFCSNTKYLREKYGWSGLLLEGSAQNNSTINLHQEFITAENINQIFNKYKVPHEFDLLSIDIDRNDFYVWRSLSEFYKPRVVVIEFNSAFNFDQDYVIKYEPNSVWDGSFYTGSSIKALFNLGSKLGYSLVYQESSGNNLFFIKNEIIQNAPYLFKNTNDVSKLYTCQPKKMNALLLREMFIASATVIS